MWSRVRARIVEPSPREASTFGRGSGRTSFISFKARFFGSLTATPPPRATTAAAIGAASRPDRRCP